ncbi:hypothetical protein A8A01_13365 [Ewingella americana]|nr:hypothetical protein A8A01_13365 [Ewingella americana]
MICSPADMQQGIPIVKSPLAALSAQLDGLMLRDRQRLQRRLQGARKLDKPDALDALSAEIQTAITESLKKVSAREASRPKISYPENLPVSQKKDDIYNAIPQAPVPVSRDGAYSNSQERSCSTS